MKIRECFYNEDTRTLYVEFSTNEDGDDFYRELELEYWEIEYYSTEIVNERTLKKITEDYLIELLTEFLTENDLPKEQPL